MGRFDFAIRKMAGGSIGGHARVATPLGHQVVPVAVPTPGGVACPTFVGTIADAYEYPLELSTDGTLLYIVEQDISVHTGEQVSSYNYPTLTPATSFSANHEGFVIGIAASSGGTVVAAAGTFGLFHIYRLNGGFATYMTAPSQHTLLCKRWCHAPSSMCVMETWKDGGNVQHVILYDMNIDTGSFTTILADTPIAGTGASSVLGYAPTTTPDGAVWFTVYISTTPGNVFRWHPDTGLQMAAGIGYDIVTPFTGHPGPFTNTGVDLVAQADSTVAAHFYQSGGTEQGVLIAPDLTVTDFECYTAFYDGPGFLAGAETGVRIAAYANTPDFSTTVLSPYNGVFNYYWGTDGSSGGSTPPPPPPPPPPTTGPELTWAPPTLSSPTTINVSNANHTITMNPSLDYIINVVSPITVSGGLTLTGGRNVVLIGGEVNFASFFGTSAISRGQENRGLYLKNWTGTMHIEGLAILGALGEGIDVDTRTVGAVLQIENVYVAQVQGSQSLNHADVIQNWGGPTTYRIDGLTGSTNYQGLFLQSTQFGSATTQADFRRVNLSGGRYLIYRTTGSTTSINLEDVWLQPQSPWTAESGGYPTSDPSWSALHHGTPSGGNFVTTAGMSYVSPGYV